MQFRRTIDVLMEGRQFHEKALSHPDGSRERKEAIGKAEYLYHQYLNKNPSDPNAIHLLGSLYMMLGFNGLATMMFRAVVGVAPDFGPAWNHLGICLQRENHYAQADHAFEQAEQYLQDDEHWADIPSNRAGSFINVGKPEVALGHANRALERAPNNGHARWHKGLALLEMQNWAEGWDFYESRMEIDSGTSFKKRNYHPDGETPLWDGNGGKIVVVHGEQGLGDELLSASCLPDAIRANPDTQFVVECNPRSADLLARAFPTVKVVGTHKLDGREWITDTLPDAKVAIGSLPKFYRRKDADFPGTPFLVADPLKARTWRQRLDALPGPRIGIAWQGGAERTRVDLRSTQLGGLYQILSLPASFISLQYTPAAQAECDDFEATTGIKVHHWPEAAQAENLDDLAAMISQLDLVVTVCQTCVHIAGGLGVPTAVMVPTGPSWRYGITGNMPWYGSVDLYRQEIDGEWGEPVARIAGRVRDLIEQREAA